MAVPKRRHSKARTRTRRSTWVLQAPGITACPQCREPKRPHYVCGNCGYYDGRQAVTVATKEDDE